MNNYIPILQEQVNNGPLEFEQLIERRGALVITLTDAGGRRTQVTFDSHMAYRKLDEGDALLSLAAMRKSGGTAKYFYRVENSDFVDWFRAECCGERQSDPVTHYSIAAANDIIDVLALGAPVLEIL